MDAYGKEMFTPMIDIEYDGSRFMLGRLRSSRSLRLLVRGDSSDFQGDQMGDAMIGPLSVANSRALQARLPWLVPQPLGARLSFGFGDRLGSATPGHIAALRAADPRSHIAPILAQQSVRENERLHRTPAEVMAAAVWGAFASDWRHPWGADADHVKEIADIAPFMAAGYTFFTIDPSDYVDNDAQRDDLNTLRTKSAGLPWNILETELGALHRAYCSAPIELDGLTLQFDEETLLRALAKYGWALGHTLAITAALQEGLGLAPFDIEMSVDETNSPTSVHEHFFIANELLRRGVPVTSLAPRFVGKFQKGVDYIGDLDRFEADLIAHVAVVAHFDRYKLSIHTGSDKFRIYPLIARRAQERVHVKTAGTSYLEALRIVAEHDPTAFRTMLDTGHACFERDKKSYFLDCRPERVAHSADLADDELPALLDQFDARQLLHVTFGSVLEAHGALLRALLDTYAEEYRRRLQQHFGRHLQPFV